MEAVISSRCGTPRPAPVCPAKIKSTRPPTGRASAKFTPAKLKECVPEDEAK
jgi:hypothetical protein